MPQNSRVYVEEDTPVCCSSLSVCCWHWSGTRHSSMWNLDPTHYISYLHQLPDVCDLICWVTHKCDGFSFHPLSTSKLCVHEISLFSSDFELFGAVDERFMSKIYKCLLLFILRYTFNFIAVILFHFQLLFHNQLKRIWRHAGFGDSWSPIQEWEGWLLISKLIKKEWQKATKLSDTWLKKSNLDQTIPWYLLLLSILIKVKILVLSCGCCGEKMRVNSIEFNYFRKSVTRLSL